MLQHTRSQIDFLTEFDTVPVSCLNTPRRKHALIGRNDMDNLDDLADNLLGKVDEYMVNIETIVGTGKAPTEINARRAHSVFDVMKIAVTEALLMDEEALLLKAYAQPNASCRSHMEELSVRENVQILCNVVESYSKTFKGTVFLTHAYRVRDFFLDKLIAHVYSASPENEKMEKIINNYRAELLFDFEHLSYEIRGLQGFLRSFANRFLDR